MKKSAKAPSYPPSKARKSLQPISLRDMAMNQIFRGFCINRFGLGPLHYILSRSDFGFEFAEIFIFEKRLPASVSRGVDKIAWSIHFFQTFK
jgi:hypothetical protein